MSPELEQKLIDQFPTYFPKRSIEESLICFGCECEDGWYPIIEQLCKDIQRTNPSEFEFTQIKEKWGLLRIYHYVRGDYTRVQTLIDHAEYASKLICENCGSTKNVITKGSWIKTLCGECRNG